MTNILSWNIQNGKGTDGVVSLERIAKVIASIGDPDVICLQEVSTHLQLIKDGPSPDQVAEIASLFPGYEVIFGAAVESGHDGTGPRWQFGNATLTRLPILSVFLHPLPQPSKSGIRHMARQATEVSVETSNGPLRVVNTHLEYHSANQRLAQIERLRSLHEECLSNMESAPNIDMSGPYQKLGRPVDCVICGDFNMETDFGEYAAMLAPLAGGAAPLQDAWRLIHSDRPHDPTCGIHDHDQWPQGSHCRDFFFVTDEIAKAVRGVVVDVETNASDHQPLMLTLADE
jgi:endonuclease/exonuclease/phosphatase family metal-dependent hydrolase